MIALTTETLEESVKPELRDQWPKIYLEWFADILPAQGDELSREEEKLLKAKEKTPGYLKEEFSSSDGLYIGLSSKCYLATKSKEIKRSQKGTPKHLGSSEQNFKNCLFENEIPKFSYKLILTDPKRATCVTKTVTKKSLNPFYYKHYVSDNLVDVSPYKNDEGFL